MKMETKPFKRVKDKMCNDVVKEQLSGISVGLSRAKDFKILLTVHIFNSFTLHMWIIPCAPNIQVSFFHL